ncbi:hypothetical protein D3C76_1049560 [compost metagenome]
MFVLFLHRAGKGVKAAAVEGKTALVALRDPGVVVRLQLPVRARDGQQPVGIGNRDKQAAQRRNALAD